MFVGGKFIQWLIWVQRVFFVIIINILVIFDFNFFVYWNKLLEGMIVEINYSIGYVMQIYYNRDFLGRVSFFGDFFVDSKKVFVIVRGFSVIMLKILFFLCLGYMWIDLFQFLLGKVGIQVFRRWGVYFYGWGIFFRVGSG